MGYVIMVSKTHAHSTLYVMKPCRLELSLPSTPPLISSLLLISVQVSGAESVRGQGKVLALQGSLFQAQLELQGSQRAQRQATRREEDLTRALHRLETDLQGVMEHRHSTERHNQVWGDGVCLCVWLSLAMGLYFHFVSTCMRLLVCKHCMRL